MGHRLIIVPILLMSLVGFGEDVWRKKPDFRDWTAEECRKVLQNSPWVQHWDNTRAQIARLPPTMAQAAAGEGSDEPSSGRASALGVTYTVMLWSATPLRQAHVRLTWLDPRLDKMNEEQRAELVDDLKEILEPSDNVVVRVIYGSNVPDWDRDLAFYWQQQTLERVKNTIHLMVGNRRINPIGFSVVGGAARQLDVAFPRMLDNQPTVTPQTKAIGFELQGPAIGPNPSERVFVEFKTKSMVVADKLEY